MTDHHDEAEAYRNRAERAEQECAEKDAEIARWRTYAQTGIDQCSNPDCATCDDLRALIAGEPR